MLRDRARTSPHGKITQHLARYWYECLARHLYHRVAGQFLAASLDGGTARRQRKIERFLFLERLPSLARDRDIMSQASLGFPSRWGYTNSQSPPTRTFIYVVALHWLFSEIKLCFEFSLSHRIGWRELIWLLNPRVTLTKPSLDLCMTKYVTLCDCVTLDSAQLVCGWSPTCWKMVCIACAMWDHLSAPLEA